VTSDIRKKLILVVDDEPMVLRFLEIELRLWEFDVASTTSGATALEMVRSEGPDIMLLDIIMPDMDGFEVLRRLREFSDIPVFAISAGIHHAEKARQLGANEFFTKPFQVSEIVPRIHAYIK
jgi:two-component system KDP operon response regulator KdpE